MGKRKRVNPRRRPVSEADTQKARLQGAEFMFTVIVHVCKDKLAIPDEVLQRLGPEIDYFCDSIRRGYVSYDELKEAQRDEGYSVSLRG